MPIPLVWLPLAFFFFAAAVFRKFPRWTTCLRHWLQSLQLLVIIAPFLRPANGVGDTPPLPYYLWVHSFILTPENSWFKLFVLIRYCLVGIGVLTLGVIYWAVWRVVLPKIFAYDLVPNKVVLDDGTVVNVVGSPFFHSFRCMADLRSFLLIFSLNEIKNKLQYMFV